MNKDDVAFVPIKGFEELYLIGNNGSVKIKTRWYPCGKVKDRVEKTKKCSKDAAGYVLVTLSKSGIRFTTRMHILVAKHFIANPDNKPEVGHINRDKSDNRAINLRWMTRLENEQDAWIKGEKRPGKYHPCSKSISQYTLDGILVKNYENGSFAQKETGFDRSVIQRSARGVIRQAYGFVWKYVN